MSGMEVRLPLGLAVVSKWKEVIGNPCLIASDWGYKLNSPLAPLSPGEKENGVLSTSLFATLFYFIGTWL